MPTTYPGKVQPGLHSLPKHSPDFNSFVDRDMFMRYEWGMEIGHTYSWKDCMPYLQPKSPNTETPESESETEADEGEGQERNKSQGSEEQKQNLESEDEDAFFLEDRENALWSDEEDEDDDGVDEDPTDDEAYLEEIDMYES